MDWVATIFEIIAVGLGLGYALFALWMAYLVVMDRLDQRRERKQLSGSRGKFSLMDLAQIDVDCWNDRGYWDRFGIFHPWDNEYDDDPLEPWQDELQDEFEREEY